MKKYKFLGIEREETETITERRVILISLEHGNRLLGTIRKEKRGFVFYTACGSYLTRDTLRELDLLLSEIEGDKEDDKGTN
jgi:hypothetical protein